MRLIRTFWLVVGATACWVALTAIPVGADDYGDLDYLVQDLDNVSRSLNQDSRQIDLLTDLDKASTLVVGGLAEWLSNLATQVSGLPSGRLFVSLGQLLPTANVGDPASYGDIDPVEVDFVSRTGALLHG